MESVFEIENHSKEIHLNGLFSNALHRQKTFKRVVPSHEDWTNFELNNFLLESSQITRVYSINHCHEIADEIGEVLCKFEICLQIIYKEKNFFLFYHINKITVSLVKNFLLLLKEKKIQDLCVLHMM